jgi:hypothetical protein
MCFPSIWVRHWKINRVFIITRRVIIIIIEETLGISTSYIPRVFCIDLVTQL